MLAHLKTERGKTGERKRKGRGRKMEGQETELRKEGIHCIQDRRIEDRKEKRKTEIMNEGRQNN